MLLPLLNARPMTSRLRNWEQALPGVTTTATSLSSHQPLLRLFEVGVLLCPLRPVHYADHR